MTAELLRGHSCNLAIVAFACRTRLRLPNGSRCRCAAHAASWSCSELWRDECGTADASREIHKPVILPEARTDPLCRSRQLDCRRDFMSFRSGCCSALTADTQRRRSCKRMTAGPMRDRSHKLASPPRATRVPPSPRPLLLRQSCNAARASRARIQEDARRIVPNAHLFDAEGDPAPPFSSTRMPARSALAMSDPQRRRSCKCVSPGPISSTRGPARFHACSSALAVLQWQMRSIAGAIGERRQSYCEQIAHEGSSSTCPEAPASDCLAEAGGRLCCRTHRNDHVSSGWRAPVQLSVCLQVVADKQMWPCRHTSQNCSRCNYVNVRFR